MLNMTFWKTYFELLFLISSFSHNSDIFLAIQSLYFKILREKRQNCEFISSNYYLITLVTIVSHKVQIVRYKLTIERKKVRIVR